MIRSPALTAALVLAATACSQTGPTQSETASTPQTPPPASADIQTSSTAPSDAMTETPPHSPEFAENAADPVGSAAVQLPGAPTRDLTGEWRLSTTASTLRFAQSNKGTTSGRVTLVDDWPSSDPAPAFWVSLPNGEVTLMDEDGAPVWKGIADNERRIQGLDDTFNLIRE
ncbi:MAG: hypothetical protein QNI84_06500 [Henriciella sp.]|nr:hypothetical protein [Henriciella sp.]